MSRPLLRSLFVGLLAGAPAAGAAGEGREHERRLPEITVTATPLAQPGAELVQPVAVLAGAALERQRAATVGRSVEQVLGVQSSYFGPGVGRPIVRGLDGARVGLLANGTPMHDVSTLSVDHAVTIEPFLADQIEVLKGPATLLYGSGAIGGIVNVVDGRIPATPVDGILGRAELGHEGVNAGRLALARLDAGNGRLGLHADYAWRDGDDFDAPGGGRIENSALERRSGAIGVSLAGEAGYLGFALSDFDSVYGIPVAEDEDAAAQTTRLAAKGRPRLGLSRQAKGAGDEKILLDMSQQRADVQAGLRATLPGLSELKLRGGRSDYRHVELEIEDDETEIGTVFDNEATDLRLEALIAPHGAWTGALGIQYGRRNFAAAGAEAFVPPAQTRELGFYALALYRNGPWTSEFGLRLDEQDADAEGFAGRSHRPHSVSAGLLYEVTEQWHLTLNVDHAERAPQIEELYSDGPHAATVSYEIGDPALAEERARQIELGLHWHAAGLEAKASAYFNDFADFIYLAATGAIEDELPVRQWTQADARFVGAEAELNARLAETDAGRFELRVFADHVRGRLARGGDLPRIAPARFGAALGWERGEWRASLGAIRYADQDRVAAFESPTPGHTLLNAHLSWAIEAGPAEWELYLDGSNLTDRKALVHTSFLKERAPLPGRGIAFGVRAWF